MANAGDDFVKNLEDTLSFKPQRDAISNAIGKAKSALGMGGSSSSSDSSNSSSKPDTSWHDEQVQKANDSFKPKAAPTTPAKPMPKYKKGTDYVPKTGPAILHKGEAVLPKEEAEQHRKDKMDKKTYDVSSELGGKKEEKPKKEIHHIKTHKAANGGHVHVHVHTHPEAHPDEMHTTQGDDEMADHMMQHMGTPNPGEAEADAGQSGIPGAAAQGASPQGAPVPQAGGAMPPVGA